ncbi:fimbria/pilus outer membrane usher protein [Pandoraea sputorum]|uniref:F1 capsule-anchoring protein n=1 Tax=Pandoraea sputorum TaxID=93222 RepID=A0A5E5ASF7_9BURK|nr:fimbria/pilus outer membrane usher protein [Pandoraea sputorum]VVE75722.1 F1 capsule-anchoring protein [Pandoraea sputorum]
MKFVSPARAVRARRRPPSQQRLLATLPIGLCNAGVSSPVLARNNEQAAVQFDPQMLRSLGLDQRVADYFRQAPRFVPGKHAVTLSVNGTRKGLIDADFDEDGSLCFTRGFFYQAGLVPPEGAPVNGDATAGVPQCYDFGSMYPKSVVNLHPGSNAVDLVVPTEALAQPKFDTSHYARGGKAALLNYNVIGTSMRNGGASTQYWQADTEIGFNVLDWTVRSRQVAAVAGGRTNWSHQYAYAQHTLVDQKSVVQFGQINVTNSLFGIGSVYGVQLFPETALETLDQPSPGRVSGIAQTQARVEVRQLGAMLLSTLVPAGPFTLGGFRLINATADLNVTVFEANGEQHSFVVPAATFNAGAMLGNAQGYSIAVGKMQSAASVGVTPWFVTASKGWRLRDFANVRLGALVTAPYQAFALASDVTPVLGVASSFNVLSSNARSEGVRGVQGTVSLSTALAASVSVNASVMRQTSGYRDLGDVTVAQQQTPSSSATAASRVWLRNRTRAQYSAGVSWNHRTLGGFALSYARSEQFGGGVTQRLIGSWSYSFKYASVSLNIERDVGSGPNAGTGVYLSASIPMGRRNVRPYFNMTNGQSRSGVNYSENVSPSFSYGISADRASAGNHTVSASANILSRYAQLGLNASASQQSSTTLSAQLSGGIVAYSGGAAFSTYRVSDTFGVANLVGVPGVQINTTAGPVWTDAWGRAVIPSLSPYAQSRLSIDTKTLPRNVDIQNGMKILDVGYGSVSDVRFDVVKVRRLLLTTTLPGGTALPLASAIFDADNQYVTTSGEDGAVFLASDKFKLPLHALMTDNKSCYLHYKPPEKQNLDRFYDALDATCDSSRPQ